MTDPEYRCSFCNKTRADVGLLVGYAECNTLICNSCIIAVTKVMIEAHRRRGLPPPLRIIDDTEKVRMN